MKACDPGSGDISGAGWRSDYVRSLVTLSAVLFRRIGTFIFDHLVFFEVSDTSSSKFAVG